MSKAILFFAVLFLSLTSAFPVCAAESNVEERKAHSEPSPPPAPEVPKERQIDIFEAIKEGHYRIMGYFKQIKEEKQQYMAKPLERLFSQLKNELIAHMEGEERLFYPTIEQKGVSPVLLRPYYEEHRSIQGLLARLTGIPKNTKRWMEKLEEFQPVVEKHFAREEKELFPEARKVLGREQALELGARFEQKRRQEMGLPQQ